MGVVRVTAANVIKMLLVVGTTHGPKVMCIYIYIFIRNLEPVQYKQSIYWQYPANVNRHILHRRKLRAPIRCHNHRNRSNYNLHRQSTINRSAANILLWNGKLHHFNQIYMYIYIQCIEIVLLGWLFSNNNKKFIAEIWSVNSFRGVNFHVIKILYEFCTFEFKNI